MTLRWDSSHSSAVTGTGQVPLPDDDAVFTLRIVSFQRSHDIVDMRKNVPNGICDLRRKPFV